MVKSEESSPASQTGTDPSVLATKTHLTHQQELLNTLKPTVFQFPVKSSALPSLSQTSCDTPAASYPEAKTEESSPEPRSLKSA